MQGYRKEKEEGGDRLIATNRRAYHDFFIDETYEAGLALVGTEVKSCRNKKVDLKDSFARFEGEALFLYNTHISSYTFGNIFNHEPLRKRKLLLNKRELLKLFGKVQQQGLTLIPLKLYFNKRGWVKVLLALARGKKQYDKRETLAKKSARREIERGMKSQSTKR